MDYCLIVSSKIKDKVNQRKTIIIVSLICGLEETKQRS